MITSPIMASTTGNDRLTQLKAFDDTKAGVKGLVDAGVTAVPPIFHNPPDPHDTASNAHAAAASLTTIPVIDLAAFSATNNDDHKQLVAQVKAAAETVGFFQVVNHGIPAELLARVLASVESFNEEPADARRPYYTRDPARRVRYLSNFDLFSSSPAANWRDTIILEASAAPEEMPPALMDVVPEYMGQVRALGAHLLALLSEALGLHAGYLQHDAGCLDDQDGPRLACHYYPPCPEPRLTLGSTRHSDNSVFTVLLQDASGGLQAFIGGRWVDVPPLPGALVVNLGDFIQLMSNDIFKSVEHRVLAVAGAAARVSVACFFRPSGVVALTRVYGPIPDLVKPPEDPHYRSVTAMEFLDYYMQKGLDGRSALDHFRLLL